MERELIKYAEVEVGLGVPVTCNVYSDNSMEYRDWVNKGGEWVKVGFPFDYDDERIVEVNYL